MYKFYQDQYLISDDTLTVLIEQLTATWTDSIKDANALGLRVKLHLRPAYFCFN